jgi:hypothetical protein
MSAVGLPWPRSALPLAIALALAACADPSTPAEAAIPGGPVEADADGRVDEWPPIHLDQVQEQLVDGQNAARRDYNAALDRCRATGWPVRELSDVELQKLGTLRVRMWISPELEVIRSEQWQLGMEEDAPVDSCLFRLRYGGRYSYADGETAVSRGLGDDATAAGEAEASGDGGILPRYALEPAAGAPPGFQDLGSTQVAGQPCHAWRGSQVGGAIEQCIWSGGRGFGFDDHSPGEACSPARPIAASLDGIVLSQEPVDGDGCRIRTATFTVGEALDRGAYRAPEAGDGA